VGHRDGREFFGVPAFASEARWSALPEGQRPATAEHVPGLGWLVAAPGRIGPDPA
jgi:hypothetical protein